MSTAFISPHMLWHVVFSLLLIPKYFLRLLVIYSLTYWLLKNCLILILKLNINIYFNIFISVFLLFLIFSFMCCDQGDTLHEFNICKSIETCLWPNTWFIIDNVLCTMRSRYIVQLLGVVFYIYLTVAHGLQCWTSFIFLYWLPI